jgi:autotransporter-associated beta strand protein
MMQMKRLFSAFVGLVAVVWLPVAHGQVLFQNTFDNGFFAPFRSTNYVGLRYGDAGWLSDGTAGALKLGQIDLGLVAYDSGSTGTADITVTFNNGDPSGLVFGPGTELYRTTFTGYTLPSTNPGEYQGFTLSVPLPGILTSGGYNNVGWSVSVANYNYGGSFGFQCSAATGQTVGYYTNNASYYNGSAWSLFSFGQDPTFGVANFVATITTFIDPITINVASGTQTQSQAGYPLLSGSAPVQKTGAGAIVMNAANTVTGSTTVQQGTLQLANAAALAASRVTPLAGGTVTLSPYLATTVGGLNPNAGGLVDVGNGSMTVTSGLTVPNMLTAITVGYNGGTWTGTTGITSSTAAADTAAGAVRAIGWLDNGDGSVTFAFAAPGDTNLDGLIDVLDAAALSSAARFNDTAVWSEGDFNYDGIYDDLDNALFVSTGLFDAGPYNAPPGAVGSIAAVPEPAGPVVAGLGIGLAGMMLGRRGWPRVTSRGRP